MNECDVATADGVFSAESEARVCEQVLGDARHGLALIIPKWAFAPQEGRFEGSRSD
jgi:hypothetical protein